MRHLVYNVRYSVVQHQLIDWLIDLQWIRALTVPKHLGLMDRPFVPYNLISSQESPVPLPKFQMARWLKILMSFGFKNGNQIYYSFLSRTFRQANPLQNPERGPMEGDNCLQCIFTYLLLYLFISKALWKERSCSPKAGSLWKQTPIPDP
jgi:hypothetical protein